MVYRAVAGSQRIISPAKYSLMHIILSKIIVTAGGSAVGVYIVSGPVDLLQDLSATARANGSPVRVVFFCFSCIGRYTNHAYQHTQNNHHRKHPFFHRKHSNPSCFFHDSTVSIAAKLHFCNLIMQWCILILSPAAFRQASSHGFVCVFSTSF